MVAKKKRLVSTKKSEVDMVGVVRCWFCEGTKRDYEGDDCPRCQGKGYLRVLKCDRCNGKGYSIVIGDRHGYEIGAYDTND